jgi:hypothetical protein
MLPIILYSIACFSGLVLGTLLGFATAGLLTDRQRSRIASDAWSQAAAHFHDLYNATPPITKPQNPFP